MAGIIGANMTLTGMLLSDKVFTVSSLFCMVVVRGSKTRLVCSDSDVIDTFTPMRLSLARAFKRSKSRQMRAFLVMIPTGCLYLKNTSKHCLVISNCFSAGWKQSVLPD